MNARWHSAIGFAAFFLVAASAAMAAGDSSQRALDPVWSEIGRILGAGLAALIVGLISRLATEAQERGLISAEMAASVDARAAEEAARIAVGVEIWALKQGRALEGEDKLAEAVKRLMARFPALSAERAVEIVEAALVPLGAGAARLLARWKPHGE